MKMSENISEKIEKSETTDQKLENRKCTRRTQQSKATAVTSIKTFAEEIQKLLGYGIVTFSLRPRCYGRPQQSNNYSLIDIQISRRRLEK